MGTGVFFSPIFPMYIIKDHVYYTMVRRVFNNFLISLIVRFVFPLKILIRLPCFIIIIMTIGPYYKVGLQYNPTADRSITCVGGTLNQLHPNPNLKRNPV